MRQDRVDAAWKGTAHCRDCGIRHLVLFADLQAADFDLIHMPIEEMDFAAGQTLYSTGGPGKALYTVRSGLVKLVQYLPDGNQRIVRLLKRGTTAGLETLLDPHYEHTAIAVLPTSVCRIPRQVVDRLSQETPRLHQQLMRRWHDALNQADSWLTELSTGKAPQRLARLLTHLADDDGIVILLSREDLGAMLGISSEHASRTVGELRRQGAITELASNHYRCDMTRLTDIGADV